MSTKRCKAFKETKLPSSDLMPSLSPNLAFWHNWKFYYPQWKYCFSSGNFGKFALIWKVLITLRCPDLHMNRFTNHSCRCSSAPMVLTPSLKRSLNTCQKDVVNLVFIGFTIHFPCRSSFLTLSFSSVVHSKSHDPLPIWNTIYFIHIAAIWISPQ